MLRARPSRQGTFVTSLLTRRSARARSTGVACGRAGPTITRRTIYLIGTRGSRFDGLNSSTGAVVWSVPANDRMSSPGLRLVGGNCTRGPCGLIPHLAGAEIPSFGERASRCRERVHRLELPPGRQHLLPCPPPPPRPPLSRAPPAFHPQPPQPSRHPLHHTHP